MIEVETDEEHRILLVTTSGTIHADDYQAGMPKLVEAVAGWDHFRVLLDRRKLEDWAPDAESDRLLALREFKPRLDRVAIVAAPALAAAAAYASDVISCEMRVFDPSEREEALAWLRSRDGDEAPLG